MGQGMPIKKIAKEIGISIQTSFDWRHKILSSLAQIAPEQLSSEVECDESELAISNKGSRNLDRKPRKRGNDFKRNMGKEEVTVVQIVTAVERKLTNNTTLTTNKYLSFKAFAKDNPKLKHKVLLVKEHVDRNDKTINLQKVNNVHAELRKFLQPFNGVSSKYLQNYLNKYVYADKLRGSKIPLKQ
jgi:hypothetical protein